MRPPAGGRALAKLALAALTLGTVVLKLLLATGPAAALPPQTRESVVSVLPVWPERPQGGTPGGAAGGTPGAPEGSGVAVAPGGLIATARHVVAPAERIDVRLADGRILPAELVGEDAASDIALLRVAAELPPLPPAPRPRLAQPVCAIANAYGLGLSVSCGVVSALDVAEAGFNPVEDFVQTDAAANPGSSGGALVDADGRLVGLVSAIFASDGDTNIGINFAVSQPLLARVVADLRDDGAVSYVAAGWRLAPLTRAERAALAGVRVAAVLPDGAASAAGIEPGDLLLALGPRRVTSPRAARAALALVPPGGRVAARLRRDGAERSVTLDFAPPDSAAMNAAAANAAPADPGTDCPHPQAVCAARAAVFPGRELRPAGQRRAHRPGPAGDQPPCGGRPRHRPGADAGGRAPGRGAALGLPRRPGPAAGRGPARVGADSDPRRPWTTPGASTPRPSTPSAPTSRGGRCGSSHRATLILPPAAGAPLGRLQVTPRACSRGSAAARLLDAEGRLVGIAVGGGEGGEGRYAALPAGEIRELLALRDAPEAAAVQAALGAALSGCADAVERAERAGRGPLPDQIALALAESCRASENLGHYLEAGRLFGLAGDFERAIALQSAAVAQAPNAINARIALLVSLQLAGRIAEMLPHARWLFEVLPDDRQAQRFAIQAGTWGRRPRAGRGGLRPPGRDRPAPGRGSAPLPRRPATAARPAVSRAVNRRAGPGRGSPTAGRRRPRPPAAPRPSASRRGWRRPAAG